MFLFIFEVNINNNRTCSTCRQFKSLKEQCRPAEIKTHMFIYSCIQYMYYKRYFLVGEKIAL
jgi:hypothetical protein